MDGPQVHGIMVLLRRFPRDGAPWPWSDVPGMTLWQESRGRAKGHGLAVPDQPLPGLEGTHLVLEAVGRRSIQVCSPRRDWLRSTVLRNRATLPSSDRTLCRVGETHLFSNE